MSLKKEIIDLLGSQYQPSDEPLVNELIYNFGIVKEAKLGLKQMGLVINTVKNPKKDPYYQKSPYFAIYDTALKNINSLYSKLNVSPMDRRSWNLDTTGEDDFDETFN